MAGREGGGEPLPIILAHLRWRNGEDPQ